MSRKTAYIARHEGREFVRRSAREYRFAAIYQRMLPDGTRADEWGATFHGTREAAEKASYFWWSDHSKPTVKRGRLQGGKPSLRPSAVVPVVFS